MKSEAEEFDCLVKQAGLSGHFHIETQNPTEVESQATKQWFNSSIFTRGDSINHSR